MNNVTNFNRRICNDYFLSLVIIECSSANVSLYWYGRVTVISRYFFTCRSSGQLMPIPKAIVAITIRSGDSFINCVIILFLTVSWVQCVNRSRRYRK